MPGIFKAAGTDFAAFYLRHFKAIYRVCYAFLKSAESEAALTKQQMLCITARKGDNILAKSTI